MSLIFSAMKCSLGFSYGEKSNAGENTEKKMKLPVYSPSSSLLLLYSWFEFWVFVFVV